MLTLPDTKLLQTTIPSGAGTSSGVMVGGYRGLAVAAPVLTSAVLSLIGQAGGAWLPLTNTAGALQTLATPGGTGGVLADGLSLPGYSQELRLSAAAAQQADRAFTLFFKG